MTVITSPPVSLLWVGLRLAIVGRSLCGESAELQGDSEGRASSRQRVWPQYRQPLVARALRNYRLGQLTALLAHAAEVDGVIKGVSQGRPWDELTQLVIGMLNTDHSGRGRAA